MQILVYDMQFRCVYGDMYVLIVLLSFDGFYRSYNFDSSAEFLTKGYIP